MNAATEDSKESFQEAAMQSVANNPSTHSTGASVLEHGTNSNFPLSGEMPPLSLLCRLGSQCPPQLGSSTAVGGLLSNRFDDGHSAVC